MEVSSCLVCSLLHFLVQHFFAICKQVNQLLVLFELHLFLRQLLLLLRRQVAVEACHQLRRLVLV